MSVCPIRAPIGHQISLSKNMRYVKRISPDGETSPQDLNKSPAGGLLVSHGRDHDLGVVRDVQILKPHSRT